MRTLIVYYSFTHNNQQLAEALQEKLKCDMHRIDTVKTRSGWSILLDLLFKRTPEIKSHSYPVEAYDQCIFISPVWGGKIATPLKAFLEKEKYNVNRYSFITLCGGYAGQKEKLRNELTHLLEQEPGLVEELWVNDILPPEKKNTIRYTSGYRMQPVDMLRFRPAIDEFLNKLETSYQLKRRVHAPLPAM